jgi:hypothetical protein
MTDWNELAARCEVAGLPAVVYAHLTKSGEAFASGIVRGLLVGPMPDKSLFEGIVPEIIRWEPEFPVPRGRVDYVIFHIDGSVTVCEVKDGGRGLQNVLAGIGQVLSYAAQVGMARAGFREIRKALIFSSLSLLTEDALVMESCEMAGVIPVPLGKESKHREAAAAFLNGLLGNGRTKES